MSVLTRDSGLRFSAVGRRGMRMRGSQEFAHFFWGSTLMKPAIVTDSVLLEVEALFNRRVVTPSTLFSLDSLVQAIVLHDKVFLGMSGAGATDHVGTDFLREKLPETLVQKPRVGEFNAMLGADNLDWSAFADQVSPSALPACTDARLEIASLNVVHDFLRVGAADELAAPDALLTKFGVAQSGHQGNVVDRALFDQFNDRVVAAGGERLSANDLSALRDLAGLTAASLHPFIPFSF